MAKNSCYIFLLKTNKKEEVPLKFTYAQSRILAHLEKRITFDAHVQHVIKELFGDAPEDLDFSLPLAKQALARMRYAEALQPHVDLESWLEALADELYQVGLRMDAACSCGRGCAVHVSKALLLFIAEYGELVLTETVSDLETTILLEKGKECRETFEQFRPSDN